jgi:hypothetical protein
MTLRRGWPGALYLACSRCTWHVYAMYSVSIPRSVGYRHGLRPAVGDKRLALGNCRQIASPLAFVRTSPPVEADTAKCANICGLVRRDAADKRGNEPDPWLLT